MRNLVLGHSVPKLHWVYCMFIASFGIAGASNENPSKDSGWLGVTGLNSIKISACQSSASYCDYALSNHFVGTLQTGRIKRGAYVPSMSGILVP